MVKLILGVGFNEGKYPTKIKGKTTREYALWSGFLYRCFDKNRVGSQSYATCQVSENFKNYSYFYRWCHQQKGFKEGSYVLDKDLLSPPEGKIYSEDTCLFIPQALNNLLVKPKKPPEGLPLGVFRSKKAYRSQISLDNKLQALGSFPNPSLAFQAYASAKEARIREEAKKYLTTIDVRAYCALLAYRVMPYPKN